MSTLKEQHLNKTHKSQWYNYIITMVKRIIKITLDGIFFFIVDTFVLLEMFVHNFIYLKIQRDFVFLRRPSVSHLT